MNVREYIESGMIEAYVLGLLSETERAEVEENMRAYPAIRQSVKSMEKSMANFSGSYAVAPKPEWKADILRAALADEVVEEQPTISIDRKRAPSAERRPMNFWAVAATVLLLLSLGINGLQIYRLNSLEAELTNTRFDLANLEAQNAAVVANYMQMQQDLEVFRDPETHLFVMESVEGKPAGYRADVLWNAKSEMAYIDVKNLPAPPSGKQYQLWALVGGQPVDMGVFDIANADQNSLVEMKRIGGADAFAVTLEKAGGVPAPTLEEMYIFGTPLKSA